MPTSHAPTRVLLVLTALGMSAPACAQSSRTSRPARAAQGPLVVQPGTGVGVVRLGMTRSELTQAGLALRPHPSGQLGPAVQVAGPYYIVFGSDDRVRHVEVELPAAQGVRVQSTVLPASTPLADIPRLVPGCSPVEHREGGNVVSCGAPGGGSPARMEFKQGSGPNAAVTVAVSS